MERQIIEIADRLRGMRESLEVAPENAALVCEIPVADYLKYESGEIDIPVSILHRMARHFGFDITTLLTGEEPHVHTYSLTRKGKGVTVQRRQSYNYESLAANFANRKADPFFVIVEPKEDPEITFNAHPGQEFHFMLEGQMKVCVGENELILNPGDSLYFDSALPHGMQAMNGRVARFLAVVL
ncbi:MAG: cupin domain-containing protein [Bacteroidetes bacterium]|nr:cupin domain-containing protein [Bacteroidota bacterium]MCL6102102.1 cupin domain-containing protein [Bacteroidota bacterium]